MVDTPWKYYDKLTTMGKQKCLNTVRARKDDWKLIGGPDGAERINMSLGCQLLSARTEGSRQYMYSGCLRILSRDHLLTI